MLARTQTADDLRRELIAGKLRRIEERIARYESWGGDPKDRDGDRKAADALRWVLSLP